MFFLMEWSYPIYFEVFKDGVSPGKKACGLRVLDERGLPLSFKASFLRTLLLVVDILGFGLVAFLSMLFSKKSQRLGDLLAKTMVVHELDAHQKLRGEQEKHAQYSIPLELYTLTEKYLQRAKDFTLASRSKAVESLIKRF